MLSSRTRTIVWSVFAALFGAGIFVYWSLSLFGQLELVTSQRMLRRPAQFFTDFVVLRAGTPLSIGECKTRLLNRGYREATAADAPAQFASAGGTSLDVHLRSFVAPGGHVPAGLHRLTFGEGRLERIEKLPEKQALDEVALEPIVLDHLSKDGAAHRPWITIDQIPRHLQSGVLILEDRRFFVHPGIDPRSLLRAFWVDVKRKGIYQGGSTLTQQLVKNAFLTQRRTFRRKFTEAMLAFVMEVRYSKNEILEMYLNQIYLGQNGARGIYGVEDASRSYFGKHVQELTLGESALIAGIIPAPNANNPRTSPSRALLRRNIVLDLLKKHRLISDAEWLAARGERIVLAQSTAHGTGSYFLSHVRELVEEELGRPALDRQGYRIYTSMDWEMQQAAEGALAGQSLEGALIAVDPYTGFVRALTGGRRYETSPFNRAVFAYRPPGSAFKPIVFASALESRAITLATVLQDRPLLINAKEGPWSPRNIDGMFLGEMLARDALVQSRNIPLIHVLEMAGMDRVIALASAMGIKSSLSAVPALALGASEVTPLEMTASYAAFANGGIAVQPQFIRLITDARGRVVRAFPPVTKRVLSPETASLMTIVLEDVVNRGTGYEMRRLGFTSPAAGKTGTSDHYRDAWFIGYTPELLCGVWLGHDKPASLGRSSSYLALPVWVKFMKAVQGRASSPFQRRGELREVMVDPVSGMRTRSGCTERRKEFFVRGTEPQKSCPLHPGGIHGILKKLFQGAR